MGAKQVVVIVLQTSRRLPAGSRRSRAGYRGQTM